MGFEMFHESYDVITCV